MVDNQTLSSYHGNQAIINKMNEIKEAKKKLREEIGNALPLMTAESRKDQSAAVFEKLKSLPEYQNSNRVSIYLSTEMEVDTVPILRHIFETKKKCYVPRYDGKVMHMVALDSMEDYDKLPMNKWLIKQPKLIEKREDALETGGLDVVIMPGVAFTKAGKRLGHGKGYYDSFLHTVLGMQATKPTTIAIAFKEQVKEEIPTHDHDVILDYILYDDK